MGTSYSIFAEVRVGNKWYNISPLLRELDGQVKVQPFMSGKSWLHQAVEELREYSYKCGRPDDLSDELRTVFSEPDEDIVDPFFHEMTYKEYYRQMMFSVNRLRAGLRSQSPLVTVGTPTDTQLQTLKLVKAKLFLTGLPKLNIRGSPKTISWIIPITNGMNTAIGMAFLSGSAEW